MVQCFRVKFQAELGNENIDLRIYQVCILFVFLDIRLHTRKVHETASHETGNCCKVYKQITRTISSGGPIYSSFME